MRRMDVSFRRIGAGVNSPAIEQGTYPLGDHSEGIHGYSATRVAPRNRVNTLKGLEGFADTGNSPPQCATIPFLPTQTHRRYESP